MNRTQHNISLGRTTFFTLNRIGAWFGCLHSLLHHSSLACASKDPVRRRELWSLMKTELEMLKRMHTKIQRTIQGFPTRCPREGVRAPLHCSSVADLVSTRKLSFIVSIASLPANAIARHVLMTRVHTSIPPSKSWTSTIEGLPPSKSS